MTILDISLDRTQTKRRASYQTSTEQPTVNNANIEQCIIDISSSSVPDSDFGSRYAHPGPASSTISSSTILAPA